MKLHYRLGQPIGTPLHPLTIAGGAWFVWLAYGLAWPAMIMRIFTGKDPTTVRTAQQKSLYHVRIRNCPHASEKCIYYVHYTHYYNCINKWNPCSKFNQNATYCKLRNNIEPSKYYLNEPSCNP
ncbi:MAG: hypothetical protein QXH24_02650 [Candidatus Bathyarchaeia archaeon]